MAKFIRMTDLDLKGKRVFIRADLNVPVKDGKVTSDARITASMPTIEHCHEGRRQGDGHLPPRPPDRRRMDRREFAQAGGRRHVRQAGQAGAPDQGLGRRRLRCRRRRSRAAGKLPLQQGREEERRRNREEIRRAVRRLRHGRLRHRPPRRGLDLRHRQVRPDRLRRHAAGRGTGSAAPRPWPTRPGRWSPSSAAPRSPPS